MKLYIFADSTHFVYNTDSISPTMERVSVNDLYATSLPRRPSWLSPDEDVVVVRGKTYPFVIVQGHHTLAHRISDETEFLELDISSREYHPDIDKEVEINMQSGCGTLPEFRKMCEDGEFLGDEYYNDELPE